MSIMAENLEIMITASAEGVKEGIKAARAQFEKLREIRDALIKIEDENERLAESYKYLARISNILFAGTVNGIFNCVSPS